LVVTEEPGQRQQEVHRRGGHGRFLGGCAEKRGDGSEDRNGNEEMEKVRHGYLRIR
jgi:hypothetical protein